MNIVLDAAEEVFADSTYAKASVEDIAQRAEISVGTLYNLFRSKEDIYKAVVSRSQQAFFDNAAVRLQEAHGPRDKMHSAVTYFFEHFHRYGRQMRLYVSATNGFQWELKSKLVDEAQHSQMIFLRRFTEVCERGLDEGVFKRGLPADLMAMSVLGVPHSFLLAWLERGSADLMDLLPHAITVVDRILGTDVD